MIQKPQTIVVTPWGECGFHVSIDGVNQANFKSGGDAAAQWAEDRLEVLRLRQVINDHASWLCSRTPDQVNKLDCETLRTMGQELRFLGRINE